jgi:hypothetical protein
MAVRHIKAEDLKVGMTVVGFLDRKQKVIDLRPFTARSQYVYFKLDNGLPWDRFDRYKEVPVEFPDEPVTEKMYLVCHCCGEACDSIEAAHEHGNSDPSGTVGWCGEDGFNILPESEAF